MTSISTEKISRGRATRDPLIHPLPAFTRIAGVPRSPHSSDGHSRFASRSAYPSFSNLSGHPTVGRDSFGAGAWPPTIGFTIVAAQAWSPTPLQIAAIVGGVVLFASLLI